ncbi:MAG: hypothetical protein IT445_08650 [Phycisphaeraceae bacterium]|nr:hypothetical protein [Phycisphaeraceae bacterium]
MKSKRSMVMDDPRPRPRKFPRKFPPQSPQASDSSRGTDASDRLRVPQHVDDFDDLPRQFVSPQGVTIHFNEADRQLLESLPSSSASLAQFRLSLRAAEVASHPGLIG